VPPSASSRRARYAHRPGDRGDLVVGPGLPAEQPAEYPAGRLAAVERAHRRGPVQGDAGLRSFPPGLHEDGGDDPGPVSGAGVDVHLPEGLGDGLELGHGRVLRRCGRSQSDSRAAAQSYPGGGRSVGTRPGGSCPDIRAYLDGAAGPHTAAAAIREIRPDHRSARKGSLARNTWRLVVMSWSNSRPARRIASPLGPAPSGIFPITHRFPTRVTAIEAEMQVPVLKPTPSRQAAGPPPVSSSQRSSSIRA
jgi:hypothetical protein